MLGFLNRIINKKKSKLVISLAVCENSVQMAVLKEQDVAGSDTFSWRGKQYRLVVNDECDVSKGEHTAAISILLERYKKLNLTNAPVQLVVSNALLEQVSIDKPDLPEEDIPAALQWSLKDLVKIPAADVIADYYDPPIQVSGAKKIYVVAINKKKLQPWITLLHDHNLSIQGIINEDLVLSSLVPNDKKLLLLTQNEGEHPQLHVVSNGKLVVTRKLTRTPPIHDIKIDDYQEVEALALELQRSQDFFSGQLRQAPLTTVILGARHTEPEKLGEALAAQLGLEASLFEYPDWAEELKAGDYSDLPVIGGLTWIATSSGQASESEAAA